ncbi:thiol reductant ABC exporter subunit CydD [Roseibium algae]|uniref:Thiol reductant ABC exporter subunit CydD n=1 Tax=Roseibium algae TaxID=3123038 RepID=A0ABU8TIS3_9HYPH
MNSYGCGAARFGAPDEACMRASGAHVDPAAEEGLCADGPPEGQPVLATVPGLAALIGDEARSLKRAGRLFALSDVIWIAQAWLIASVVADFVVPAAGGAVDFMVWMYSLGFVVLAFIRMQLNLRAGKLARQTARAVKSRVRADLLQAISSASPASELPTSGAVAAHVGDQVDALGPYLSNFYPQNVRLRLVPVAIILATAMVSWLAAIILLVTGPLIPVFMALIGLKAKAASEGQQEELVRMSGFLLDRVRGLETLRLFGAVERTRNQIADVGDAFRVGTMKVLRIAFLSSTVLELFSALGIAFVAVFVGFSLLGDVTMGTWGAPLSYTAGLFILLLAPDYFAPLRAYAAAYHDRAAGLAATEKLSALHAEILARSEVMPVHAVSKADQQSASETAPSVCFEDVSLCLGARQVLSSVSLRVGAGEAALLIGPSGSGKTTILDCLLGLHVLGAGKILVNDQNMAELDPVAWRQSIAWVGQAPRLFHGSLKANLLRANPGASESDMWEALALAGAVDLVERLPRGLGTVIGEDGFGLSVGEARRVGLARAAMRKDSGLILADEPTAGLDEDTAADVICGLKAMSGGKTLIVATHDPKVMAMTATHIQIRDGSCLEVVA